MARIVKGKKMADNEEMPDVEEGRLPQDVDLDGMSDDELVGLVEEALDRLPASELKAIRDLAEEKRQSKLEGAKQDVLAEIQKKLEALGLTLRDVLPQSSTFTGRRTRSDAG